MKMEWLEGLLPRLFVTSTTTSYFPGKLTQSIVTDRCSGLTCINLQASSPMRRHLIAYPVIALLPSNADAVQLTIVETTDVVLIFTLTPSGAAGGPVDHIIDMYKPLQLCEIAV